MEPLNFPEYSFRITRNRDNKLVIFDAFRKKSLLLTPEEWVRQNILRFLVEEKNFPAALISSEAGLKINTLSRRYDALIYNRKGEPLLLIECKAPKVTVNQGVFDQVIAYNQTLKAKYILVTNGLKHFCCRHDEDNGKFEFLGEIPGFDEL